MPKPTRSNHPIHYPISTVDKATTYARSTADRAASGLFRHLTTDHTGMGDALIRMPQMGFLDTVSYVLTYLLISIAGSILGAIVVFVFVAFGIPLLLEIIF